MAFCEHFALYPHSFYRINFWVKFRKKKPFCWRKRIIQRFSLRKSMISQNALHVFFSKGSALSSRIIFLPFGTPILKHIFWGFPAHTVSRNLACSDVHSWHIQSIFCHSRVVTRLVQIQIQPSALGYLYSQIFTAISSCCMNFSQFPYPSRFSP